MYLKNILDFKQKLIMYNNEKRTICVVDVCSSYQMLDAHRHASHILFKQQQTYKVIGIVWYINTFHLMSMCEYNNY